MSKAHLFVAAGTALALTAFVSPSAKAASGATMSLNDPQIAQIVKTADQAEIDMAKLAMKNTQNKDVKSFAQHMITAHGKHVVKEGILDKKEKIQPSLSDQASNLKKDADAKLSDLKNLKGAEFDKAYMAEQVKMHQELASDLQDKFVPAAKDPSFRSFLQDTEKEVRDHLKSAEQVQTALNK